MTVSQILGWTTVLTIALISCWLVWFSCGGWRQFGPPHLLPPPVPRLALVAPASDPIPGFSDIVGML
jgi:hypothetical protein